MKKQWFIAIIAVFVGLGILVALFKSIDDGRTDRPVRRTWAMSEHLKKLEIYGTQQPITIIIETDQSDNELFIEGLVPDESLETLGKDSVQDRDSLYLPFSKHGFKLAVLQNGKADLRIKLSLSDTTQLNHFLLDTWTGDVTLEVPSDFSARYILDTGQAGEVTTSVANDKKSSLTIEIKTYGHIRVNQKVSD